jgi:hypothetical protein
MKIREINILSSAPAQKEVGRHQQYLLVAEALQDVFFSAA